MGCLLETGKAYESLSQMYPLTETLRKVSFDAITTPEQRITSYKSKQTATLGGALKVAFRNYFGNIHMEGDSKDLLAATLARAVHAGFNVNHVFEGDSFEIKEKTLHYTTHKGEVYKIALYDPKEGEDLGDDYLVHKEQIKNKTRRAWEGVRENISSVDDILHLLDVDKTNNLSDILQFRSILSKRENRKVLWEELAKSEQSDTLRKQVFANGDPRLKNTLSKNPQFFQQGYGETPMHYLAIIEFVRRKDPIQILRDAGCEVDDLHFVASDTLPDLPTQSAELPPVVSPEMGILEEKPAEPSIEEKEKSEDPQQYNYRRLQDTLKNPEFAGKISFTEVAREPNKNVSVQAVVTLTKEIDKQKETVRLPARITINQYQYLAVVHNYHSGDDITVDVPRENSAEFLKKLIATQENAFEIHHTLKKKLPMLLGKIGYKGVANNTEKEINGVYQYIYTGHNLEGIKVTYRNNLDQPQKSECDVVFIRDNEPLSFEPIQGTPDDVAEQIGKELKKYKQSEKQRITFEKVKNKLANDIDAAATKKELVVEKKPRGQEKFYALSIQDQTGAERKIEIIINDESRELIVFVYNEKNKNPDRSVCKNFSECVKFAKKVFKNESVSAKIKNPEAATSPITESAAKKTTQRVEMPTEEQERLSRSLARVDLIAKLRNIEPNAREVKPGLVFTIPIDTVTEFGTQNIQIMIVDGEGYKPLFNAPNGEKNTASRATIVDAILLVQNAFEKAQEQRKAVRDALINPEIVPDTFNRTVVESDIMGMKAYVIGDKKQDKQLKVTQYPRESGYYFAVYLVDGKAYQSSRSSPKEVIEAVLNQGPQ